MNVCKGNGLNQNVLENVHPQHIALLKAHKSLRKSGVGARKSTNVLKSIHSPHITLLRTQKIGENVYDRLQMDHENVR